MRKRQRTLDVHGQPGPVDAQGPPSAGPQSVQEDAFINDHDAVDSAGDDDDDDDKPKADKKAGRRKIKIEFIQDKSRRHITFSKRKAGIMKKAYELSTLTGTQVLLLVVSETGLVYTFTTAKLQPLVTQPEGKNLIQACLNAPHGSLPSSMPVGTPIGRSSGPINIAGAPPPGPNIPGGLSIGQQQPGTPIKDDDDQGDDDEAAHGGRASSGDKRRRRASSTNTGGGASKSNARSNAPSSLQSPSSAIPPPLSIPSGGSPGLQQQQLPSAGGGAPSQIPLGASTSPQQAHSQISGGAPPPGQYASGYGGHGGHPSPHQQPQHHQQPQQGDGGGMYGGQHMMPGTAYTYGPGAQGGQQPLGGLAAAAAQQQQPHWGPPPHQQQQQQQQQVGQTQHYGRR